MTNGWLERAVGALAVAGILGGVGLAIAQAGTDANLTNLEESVQRNDLETKAAVEKVDRKLETTNKNIVRLMVKLGVEPE